MIKKQIESEEKKMKELIRLHQSKLKKIKAFVADVDGILTNGQTYYAGSELGFNRFFHVSDGFAFKFLKQLGFITGVISGGNSLGLKKRVKDLGVHFAYLGNEDKRGPYLKLLKTHKLKDEEILYMGDELFDIPILKRVGFSVTVPHASLQVKKACHYITERQGGMGCMREVADLLCYSQKKLPSINDFEASE